MFTRLLKTLSVVVLIVVLASSVSLAGVGWVGRDISNQKSGIDMTYVLWSVLLSVRPLPIV